MEQDNDLHMRQNNRPSNRSGMVHQSSQGSQQIHGSPQIIQNSNGLISVFQNQHIGELPQMGFGQLNHPQYVIGQRQMPQSHFQQDFKSQSSGNKQAMQINQLYPPSSMGSSGSQIQDPQGQYYITPQGLIQMKGSQNQMQDMYQNQQVQMSIHPYGVGHGQFLPQQTSKNIPSHQQYNGNYQHEMRMGQNIMSMSRNFQSNIHESSEVDEKNDKMEEFDSDFLFNNPGIIKTQKFLRDNQAHILETNQLEDFQFSNEDCSQRLKFHVNLATNNSKKSINFGLNQNKRGKMQDSDCHQFIKELNSTPQAKELQRNKEFMTQSPSIIQVSAQARYVQQLQFNQRQQQQMAAIQQQIQNIEIQTQQIHHREAIIQQNLLQIKQKHKKDLLTKNSQQMKPEKSQDLKNARQKLKEELKEELREQIRQELIESLPMESRKQLKEQKIDKQSRNAKKSQIHPSCFQKISMEQNLHEDSGNSSSKKAPSGAGSFSAYKFGQQIDEPKSASLESKKDQKSAQSEDSEEKEDRLLKQSYDEYGKMLTEKNQMKNKIKSSLLEIDEEQNELIGNINQEIDEESKNNSSGNNDSIGIRKNIKNNRSSSVGKDQMAQHLLKVKSHYSNQLLSYQRDRVHSIQYGKSNMQPQSYGSEGGQKFLRKHNKHIQLNDDDNDKDEAFDILEIQLEDQRLKILNEIQIIVQQQSRPGDSNKKNQNDQLPFKDLNKGLRRICENLKGLMIDFDTSKIIELQYKERKILKELIHSYKNVLINQSKFKNIENLENEGKSDEEYSDDYIENESQQRAYHKQQQQAYLFNNNQYKKKGNSKILEKGNYLIGVEDLKDDRFIGGNSVVSRGSKRYKDNSPVKTNQSKSDTSSEDIQNSEELDSSDEQVMQQKNFSSPSLNEIYRSPSYKSIDSKVKKQNAKKFDPSVMKLRGDIQSRRDSLKSAQSSQAKSKKFVQDVLSEGSGARSKKSLYRRDKLQGLEIDYHEYLQRSQGIFIIRCQMMNIELSQIREKYDLEKMMVEFKNFKKLQKETQQDEVYRSLQTVVIDIENTLVTLIDIKKKHELEQIKSNENFENDYIIMKKQQKSKSKKDKDKDKQKQVERDEICCEFKDTENCICDVQVYQVRPYTYEFLRAIQPFFEIVVFSRLHHRELEFIIDHIESVLNKPIKDFLEKFSNNRQKSSFQRMKKLPDIKIYFQFIIHQRQYIHIKEHDKYIENLMVLTKNRHKENLIFISSNPFRIVTAIKYGFLTIPVIQYESFYRDDFQLSLVEHYILKIRHLKDMKKRLKQDFKMLVQKIERNSRRPSCSSPKNGNSKSAQRRQSNENNEFLRHGSQGSSFRDKKQQIFEAASQGSFGGKKLMDRINQKEILNKSIESDSEQEEAIQKQEGSPKPQYNQIQPKQKYERGRKSSFGNLNQSQLDDQDSDESSEIQEEKKHEQPIQEENSQDQDDREKSEHDSKRSIGVDQVADQPQNKPFVQQIAKQINNQNQNLIHQHSGQSFGMQSNPSIASQQQQSSGSQSNKKTQLNSINYHFQLLQEQPQTVVEEYKEKAFQSMISQSQENKHNKISTRDLTDQKFNLRCNNNEPRKADFGVIPFDAQVNCALKNNTAGEENLFGSLSIQNHQGNIIVNVNNKDSGSSKEVSNSYSSEQVPTISSGQNIVNRHEASSQSLSKSSGNPSDSQSGKFKSSQQDSSKQDSQEKVCNQSVKSQSSSDKISIVQGRVVYNASSIILEESKDMSDLSANSVSQANNPSLSRRPNFKDSGQQSNMDSSNGAEQAQAKSKSSSQHLDEQIMVMAKKINDEKSDSEQDLQSKSQSELQKRKSN